jgi:hypothetical protein
LDHLKTYTTDRPVNSASISPIKDHLVLGGGQEAMEVNMISFHSPDILFIKKKLGHTNVKSNRKI